MFNSVGRPTEWSDERVSQLTQLWADGLSCSQIGNQMGVTRNAVIGKASRLGLPARTTLTRTARYRSGPISYTEKLRRAAERATLNSILRAAKRQRSADGRLPPLKIIETPKQVEFLALTFGELQRNQCRYPRGEGEAMRFCGQPIVRLSYCEHCYRICCGSRQPLPLLTRETQKLVVLPAGKPSSSGLTGGQSAA